MFKYYFTIVLTHLVTIIASEITQELGNVTSTEILEDFPCNGSTKILETFNTSDPTVYTITIIPAQFADFAERANMTLKFDSYTNITMMFNWLDFYDDSLTLEANIRVKDRENFSLAVQPRPGKPFPNLIGANINGEDVCPEGFHKGVWDMFAILKPPTPPLVPSTTQPTVAPDKCGVRLVQREELIISGDGARPGDWPWHTAVYKLKTSAAELTYICGGSLIAKSTVLTAGHCVVENGAVVIAERLFVSLGKYNYVGGDIGLQEKGVFKIFLHPGFIRRTLSNDLALLKLTSEAVYSDFVQPICLWDGSDINKINLMGQYGYVVGWGATRNTKFSTQLNQAVMPIQSDLACVKSNPLFFSKFLTEFTLCAGFANGTGACNGDSGGGLFIPRRAVGGAEGADMWYLRGIVSLGVSKREGSVCDPRYYTIFTDVAQYLDFIYQYL